MRLDGKILVAVFGLALSTTQAATGKEKPSYVATLPSGTAVRIVAVGDSSGRSWGPDGGVLDNSVLDSLRLEGASAFKSETKRIWIYFEVEPLNKRSDIGIEAGPDTASGDGFTSVRIGNWGTPAAGWSHGGFICIGEPKVAEGQVGIGVSEGPFKPIVRAERRGENFPTVLGPDMQAQLRQLPPDAYFVGKNRRERITFQLTCTLPIIGGGDETRLILTNRDGSDAGPGGGSDINNTRTMSYSGLAKDIKRIEFGSRPYAWTTFKGVRLRPGA